MQNEESDTREQAASDAGRDGYTIEIYQRDCLEWMNRQQPKSFDLVLGSPPYPGRRTYGIGFDRKGEAWVKWMLQVVIAAVRICRGLVVFVIDAPTSRYQWTAEPALLMADLHRAGVHLRKPPIFHRVGIPGSGGPDWLRSDYELIVCATNGGRLPWADPTAMGHPPKFPPGGRPSHRLPNGERVDGHDYHPPELANPGNIIHCKVGGRHMGNDLAHQNEAPFPEELPEFFVRSFCPPSGRVLDPFCGSGTTLAVAQRLGRQAVGVDIRPCQVEVSLQRVGMATPVANTQPSKLILKARSKRSRRCQQPKAADA